MRVLTRGWQLSLLAMTAGCGITDVDAPALAFDEEVGEPFVEEIDAASLEAIVSAGPAEFEIFFLDDGVTAGEVSVRTDDLSESESIQSSVASLDEAGGRLVLALGGIGVTLQPDTRFWLGNEAADRETVLRRIREDLASGRHTPLVVERAPAAQGSQDATFVAQDLIVGGDGSPSLRMHVAPGDVVFDGEGTANMVSQVPGLSAGKPDAWIKVLGCIIRLHMRDGWTRVVRHRHHYHGVVRFDGAVESIDLEARKLYLEDGTTIRVTGRTDIVRRREHARSLRAAAEALQAGFHVRAHGLGVREHAGKLLALSLALKLEEPEEPEVEPVVVEFESAVVDVRAEAEGSVVELANGTVVRIGTSTEWIAVDDHSPASLDALEDALEEGRDVTARGRGEVVQESPLVLRGLRIELQGEAPPAEGEMVPFVGIANFVDSDAGAVVLTDGTTVVLTEATVLAGADANSPGTLTELMEALGRNRRVEVRGEGVATGEGVVTAATVELAVVIGTFDATVDMLDPDTGGLIFAGGSFVIITEATVITAVGDGPTDLGGVDAALFEGRTVLARGSGFVRGRFPGGVDNYEAIAVEFELIP